MLARFIGNTYFFHINFMCCCLCLQYCQSLFIVLFLFGFIRQRPAMSSVAGVQPLHDGSEETLDHVCDPCNFRGLQREGSSYCKNCQEKLCQTCADAHKGQKLSRNHDLVSVSKLDMKAILRQETNSKFLCDCNQNSEVVVYCQTHDDVICRSCAVTKHRTCKTVPIGEKCALYPKENFADVVLKANKVNVETDQLLNERRSDLKSYFAMTEIAKEDMRKYRQEINQQFDMMERAILTELEDRESRNRKVVEDHILSYTTTQQLDQADLKILNDIEKTNNKADMFAADVKVSKRLTEHECLLREIHREAKSPSLTFRKNDQLVDMLIKIKNIGALVEHTIVTERKAKKCVHRHEG